jgi:sigma-B regulation protein RsbU (phosphoserine phosphatase)
VSVHCPYIKITVKETLLDQVKNVDQLLEENNRLRAAVEELSILNDIATAISSTQSLEKVVELIVHKCVKHLRVEQGAVMLLNEKDMNKPFHTMIRKQDSVISSLPFRLDAQLTGWMLKNKSPLLVSDLKTDDRFKLSADEKISIKSLLGVPLTLKGKMTGIITVFNKRDESGFTSNDQRLLSIIAAQSAQIVENARLNQEEQALMHIQEEMRVAQNIQQNLLPRKVPVFEGYEFAGKSIPAKEVGGDYYDFIPLNDGRLAFCLGDISGKGIPAALLMANLQATLRGQAFIGNECKDSVSFANNILYHNTDPTRYATLFYSLLNTKGHKITYCNAGHNNPYIFSPGKEMVRLSEGGIVVGMMPDYSFNEDSVELFPDDVFILFSDGVTEAMNSNEDEFGEERLEDIIKRSLHLKAEDIIKSIFKEVETFTRDTVQSDDITMLIIKRAK